MNTATKIELTVPRDDEKRFCDLLHLNGFKTEVDHPVDRPVVIRICIEAHQVVGAEQQPYIPYTGTVSGLC